MALRKRFDKDIKGLHEQIVDEIKQLMAWNRKAVVDLMGSEAPFASIVGIPEFKQGNEYVEGQVFSVILEDDKIKLDVNWAIDTDEYLKEFPNENDDISDLYAVIDALDYDRIVPCAGIDSVYNAVWEYLEYGYKGDNDEDIN